MSGNVDGRARRSGRNGRLGPRCHGRLLRHLRAFDSGDTYGVDVRREFCAVYWSQIRHVGAGSGGRTGTCLRETVPLCPAQGAFLNTSHHQSLRPFRPVQSDRPCGASTRLCFAPQSRLVTVSVRVQPNTRNIEGNVRIATNMSPGCGAARGRCCREIDMLDHSDLPNQQCTRDERLAKQAFVGAEMDL